MIIFILFIPNTVPIASVMNDVSTKWMSRPNGVSGKITSRPSEG